MEFQILNNELFSLSDKGDKIVSILFPVYKGNVVNIKRVFVDESLRGQGVAGIAMNELYDFLIKSDLKTIATCPYAIKWFERYKDKNDILVSSDEPVVCEF